MVYGERTAVDRLGIITVHRSTGIGLGMDPSVVLTSVRQRQRYLRDPLDIFWLLLLFFPRTFWKHSTFGLEQYLTFVLTPIDNMNINPLFVARLPNRGFSLPICSLPWFFVSFPPSRST